MVPNLKIEQFKNHVFEVRKSQEISEGLKSCLEVFSIGQSESLKTAKGRFYTLIRL